MGATNLCEAWAAFVGARLIGSLGYPSMFVVMSCLSLVAVPILLALCKTESGQGNQELKWDH